MRSRSMPLLVRVLACTRILFFSGMQGHAVAQDSANLPYMNPQLSPEQRATDLVGRMTLAEKASEMQNNSAAVPRLKIPAYQWWSEALHGTDNGDPIIAQGDYTISIGGGQPDSGAPSATGYFHIVAQYALPE